MIFSELASQMDRAENGITIELNRENLPLIQFEMMMVSDGNIP